MNNIINLILHVDNMMKPSSGMLEMSEIYFSFSCSLYEHHPRVSFFQLFHSRHIYIASYRGMSPHYSQRC